MDRYDLRHIPDVGWRIFGPDGEPASPLAYRDEFEAIDDLHAIDARAANDWLRFVERVG